MADKVIIEAEVKSNVGEVGKDAASAAGEFKVMGVSLNGVKAAFVSAGKSAKLMFGSIKAGLISTGIGVFLVAIGALVQYFKDSEEGASKFKQITSMLGVILGNVTDILSNLGKTLFETFSNPKKAITDLWNFIKTNLMNRLTGLIDSFRAAGKVIQAAINLDFEGVREGMLDYGESIAQVATGVDDVFNKTKDGINSTIEAVKDFGETTKKEMKMANQLEKDRLALQKFERKAIVEKAKTEKDMMELRLKARDFEKFAANERLGFMREANKLAAEQLEKDLHVAQEKLRFQVEENSYSKSTQQNLDDEAALQAAVFNLEKANFSERKRMKSEEQAIVKELQAAAKAEAKEKQDAIDAENKRLAEAQKVIDDKKAAADKKAADAAIKEAKRVADEKIALEELVESEKENTIQMGFAAASSLAKEGSAAAKGIAVAQTIYNTQQAIMKALADVPYPMNIIQSALMGVMGAKAIANILSTDPSGGGAGGGGAAAAPATPAPQMMSGQFELGGGIAPEATRAYVVTDEMTNSQDQLANIRRRATI